MLMINTINNISTGFRTSESQIVSEKSQNVDSVKTKSNPDSPIGKTRLKHTINDENKIVVYVTKGSSEKIVRTIPLSEQHNLDILG